MAGDQGTYKVHAKKLNEVKVGNWYYGFDCLDCSSRFAVFDDITGGSAKVNMVGEGHLCVTCPHCQSDRLYETAQVFHYQHLPI
jgi:hypothetical protein